MSAAWTLYRMLAPWVGALAPAARRFAPQAERSFWGERLGHVRCEGGCHAWVHAASLGEAVAAGSLVRELWALDPKSRLHLTAGTRAGRERLAELPASVSLSPLDAPQAMRRWFAGVAPQRLFLIETELWPHWLIKAQAEGVPAAVVSGRLSERSVRQYARLGSSFRKLVGGLAAVLCQSADDQRRWLELGAEARRTEVVGNLKNDSLPRPAPDRAAASRDLGLDPDRPVLVLGSIRPGEVRWLTRAWRALPSGLRQRWQVVAVPRHPRATRELLEEAAATLPSVVHGAEVGDGAWRWDDRSGMLNRYYAVAEAAFVGGSLVRLGGHNPLEPAACGAAVIVGPYHATQVDGVRALAAHGAIAIPTSSQELLEQLAELLSDDGFRRARGEAARAVAEGMRGAARRAAQSLEARGLWPVC